jgi:4-hydroxy-2-oxoheptanedioate aldolase
MTSTIQSFDRSKAEAFAGTLLQSLNHAACCLMASIGHRTGLFDVMRDLPPSSSVDISGEVRTGPRPDEQLVRRQEVARRSAMRRIRFTFVAGLVLAAVAVSSPVSHAQQKPLHLNPVIAKLAEGKTVYGLSTGDLSLVNARDTARAPVDFMYVDMEHNPLDLPALQLFLLGMSDRGMVLKKGNLQPNVALMARFPPEADQSQWVVKQALDIGLHGIIFNGVDTRDQALIAVRSMRYPQLKGSKHYEPNGVRGSGPANATWIWGISGDEYERRADLWPLNPEGDLLAMPMIESVEGLQNVEAIASTPGVGALFVGAGADLTRALGVRPGSPEVEAGFQLVLKACKAHKIACAITANDGTAVAKRVREGWNIIRSTVPAINAGRAILGEK